MGQMKKLWEEQREFELIEDSVDFGEVVDSLDWVVQQRQQHFKNKTLRPSESTDKWRKLEELKESKDEWHLWD